MAKDEEEKVSRISFSLRPKLREEFDRVSGEMGYKERSKALQIAIRNLIGDYEIKTNRESSVSGGILLLYDHRVHDIDRKISDIGHDYRQVIVSSTHLHLDEERCIDITAVRGKYQKIMELEQKLRKLYGVEGTKSAYFMIGR